MKSFQHFLLPAFCAVLVHAQVPSNLPFSSGFNSSFSLSDAQIKSAQLSSTMVTSINAAVNFDRSSLANGGPRQDDFYTLPPLKNSTLQPGRVLKVQEATDPAPFAITPGSSLSRILYTTRNLNGTVIPASAYILWPYEPRQFSGDGDKVPAVLWSHGTSGYFADAGPSSHRTLYYEHILPLNLVQAGYAIVAPDYAGLGLGISWDKSTISHQYIASPAGGQDTLYAMQAALEVFGEWLSGRFAIAGHSQGGGVAWSAAELLASGSGTAAGNEFEGLLDGYVGTIAIAPVTKALGGLALMSVSAAMHLSSIFPDFTLDQWLQPVAIARLKLLEEIQGTAAVAQQLFLNDLEETLVKDGWYDSSYHASAFDKLANAGMKPFASPMLVIQGTEDVFVSKTGTDRVVKETHEGQQDSDLEYMVVEGFGHTPIISAVRQRWMKWLEERFEGKKTNGGSKSTSVSGWLGDGKHFAGSNGYSQWAGASQYMYQNPGAV